MACDAAHKDYKRCEDISFSVEPGQTILAGTQDSRCWILRLQRPPFLSETNLSRVVSPLFGRGRDQERSAHKLN